MTMASGDVDYLGEYTESIELLPAEISKNMRLIGELDEKLQESYAAIDERASKLLRRTKRAKTTQSQREAWEETRKEQQESIDISDEKVALAEQLYELVDGHIRRLDDTLRKFEAELRQTDPARLEVLQLAAVQPKPFAAAGLCMAGRRGGAAAVETRALHYVDMPVDVNEPTYCYCNKVSFGEMVACDNTSCPHEWFHYGCVGLSAAPDGGWLCPTCIGEQGSATVEGKD